MSSKCFDISAVKNFGVPVSLLARCKGLEKKGSSYNPLVRVRGLIRGIPSADPIVPALQSLSLM